jgi:hypothetical protein
MITYPGRWSVPILNGDWRAVVDLHVIMIVDRLHAGVLRDGGHIGQADEPCQVQPGGWSVKQVQ